MKRPLDEIEEKLSKRGLEKRKEEVVESKEALIVNKAHEKFLKYSREYEDILKPYNRKVEDKNLQVKLDKLKSDLIIAEQDIKNLTDQLENSLKSIRKELEKIRSFE